MHESLVSFTCTQGVNRVLNISQNEVHIQDLYDEPDLHKGLVRFT